jgi:hypothetical protein
MNNTILLYTFTRAEVEQLDFTRFEQTFAHWPQLWARELREKINSLTLLVDGFDNHPEEIYQIPQVRAFYQALHRRWPWWAYFLCLETNSLPLAYLCLVDIVSTVKTNRNSNCAASFDPSKLIELLRHDFSRMFFLMDHARFTEAEVDARSKAIFKALGVTSYE